MPRQPPRGFDRTRGAAGRRMASLGPVASGQQGYPGARCSRSWLTTRAGASVACRAARSAGPLSCRIWHAHPRSDSWHTIRRDRGRTGCGESAAAPDRHLRCGGCVRVRGYAVQHASHYAPSAAVRPFGMMRMPGTRAGQRPASRHCTPPVVRLRRRARRAMSETGQVRRSAVLRLAQGASGDPARAPRPPGRMAPGPPPRRVRSVRTRADGYSAGSGQR